MKPLRLLIIEDAKAFWEQRAMKAKQKGLSSDERPLQIEVKTIDEAYNNVTNPDYEADVYVVDINNRWGTEKEATGLGVANVLHKRYPGSIFIVVSQFFDGTGCADDGYKALVNQEQTDGIWFEFLSKKEPMVWFGKQPPDRSPRSLLQPPPPETFLWQEIEACIAKSKVDVFRDFAPDVVHVMPLSAPTKKIDKLQPELPPRIRELQAYYKHLKVAANLSNFSTTQTVGRSFMFARRRCAAGLETSVTSLFQRIIQINRKETDISKKLSSVVAPSPVGEGWNAVRFDLAGKAPKASYRSIDKLGAHYNELSKHDSAPSKHFFLKFFPKKCPINLESGSDKAAEMPKDELNSEVEAFTAEKVTSFKVAFNLRFPALVFHVPPKGSACESWPIAGAWHNCD